MSSNASTDLSLFAASSSRAEQLQPDTFTHFPQLPKELRLSIWEITLPKGRIISIQRRDRLPKKTPIRLSLPQSDLPLLYTCHESRITTLKVYQTYEYEQLGYPFCFDLKTDAISLSGIELIEEFCSPYVKSGGPTSIRGITYTAGVSLARRGCHGSYDGQVLVGSFWRTMVLQRLSSLTDAIGTIQTLFVYHPQCLGTGLDGELKARLEAKNIQRDLKRSSSGVDDPETTVPIVIFQSYEGDLDSQEAERGLKELMETKKFYK